MIKLENGLRLGGQFRIDGLAPGGGGQAFSYLGTNMDNKARVFVKHYCSLFENELPELKIFYTEIFRRLDEKARGYLCLPVSARSGEIYAPVVGVQDNHSYTVFKFIEGKTLENLYQDNIPPWDLRRFLKTIFRICSNLENAGIAHLDIKPDNFLVNRNKNTERDYITLIDMDNAWLCEDADSDVQEYNGLQPVVATPFYSAPELTNGCHDKISSKSDSFSLAMVLVDLLVGRTNFYKINDMDEFYSGTHTLKLPNNDLHPLMGAMINKCLSFYPDERYPIKNMFYTIKRCAGTYFRKKQCHVCVESVKDGRVYRYFDDDTNDKDYALVLKRHDLNPIVPRLPDNSIKFTIDVSKGNYEMTCLTNEIDIYRNETQLACNRPVPLEIPQPADTHSRHLPLHKIIAYGEEYPVYIYLQED